MICLFVAGINVPDIKAFSQLFSDGFQPSAVYCLLSEKKNVQDLAQ